MKIRLSIILLLILISSCNNNNKHGQQNIDNHSVEINCVSDLKYIKRNGRIDSTMIDYIKKTWSKHHKIEFISKNDTLFAHSSSLSEKDKNPPFFLMSHMLHLLFV